jgi:hypothetical protein|tara:strand:+ start:254 stop:409 length:156 start_codon:yes stop_codon:yes gene_type:complete
MTEKQILNTVLQQINLAIEKNLTDAAPQHFKELKAFIEEERARTEKEGRWL